ncbi:MAG: hypothetical protein ACLSVD_14925 [Eggerthellaceae bacterium]
MSQRNPMNDRYQTDEHRGQTRKSAATMKPKTKAASSVRIQPTVKTKQQKKADKKAARAKQTEIDRQYYNPPTPEYKRLRKIWWGLLIGAIVMTAMSWFGRAFLPRWEPMWCWAWPMCASSAPYTWTSRKSARCDAPIRKR